MSQTANASKLPDETRSILAMVRWLLILTLVVLGYLLLRKLGPVLAPVLAAGAIAYLLDGWVDTLVAKGMKRVSAVALLMGGFFALLTGLVFVAAPLIAGEFKTFIAGLPGMIEAASVWLAANFGVELPASWSEYLDDPSLKEFIGDNAAPIAMFTAGAVGGALGVLGILAELLLIPVFAFYLLVDWDNIVDRVRKYIPARHRDEAVEVVGQIDKAVSGWIRGQLIVTTVLTILYAASFKIIGLNFGLVIGAAVGFLTVIPFLGTFVGAAMTAGVLLLNWQGPLVAGLVVAVFVILHLLEAAILTPKLVGKRVGLGELGALFAVLAGGKLLGFVGVILAVPLAAAVAVLVRRALRHYEASHFFNEEKTSLVISADGSPIVSSGSDDRETDETSEKDS